MEDEIKQTGDHLSKVTLNDQNKDPKSAHELSEDDQDIFAALITNAKQLTTEGNIKDALDLYKQALKMFYNEKLERKINKMEAYLKETSDEDAVKSTPGQKSKSEVSVTPKVSDDDKEIFEQMISSARQLVEEGKIKDALELNKEALKICQSEKLARKIDKMEIYLKQSGEDKSERTPSRADKDQQSSIKGQTQETNCSTPDTPMNVNLPDEDLEIFNQLVKTAKQYTEQGKIKDALELYKEAYKLNNNEKLAKRIHKMEMYLKQSGEDKSERTPSRADKEQQSSIKGQTQETNCSTPDTPMNVNLSDEDLEIFNQLVKTAKQYTEQGKIKDALELYKEAYKINNNEKLAKRIHKMELYLKENDADTQEADNQGEKNQEILSKEEPELPDPSETPVKRTATHEDQQRFNQLIQTAKQCTDEGHIKDALDLYHEALKIYHSEKLAKKIVKMEAYLKENENNQRNQNGVSQPNEDSKTKVSQTPIKPKVIDEQEKFNQLVTQAKQLISEGKVRDALKMNKDALEIYHSDKLAKKIMKMEQYLKEHGDEEDEENEDENGMVHVGNGYFMYRELFDKLYDHQKEAVLWMWELHKKKKGGILGDDMGLGKTIQIISFLSGLFDMDKVHSILCVMPVSLIVNWTKEFTKWSPGIRVEAYHGHSKKEKERALNKVQRRGGVLLTSYGLVVTSWETLGKQDGREFVWDYAILDEGHKIKNPTKTTKGVHAIAARNRIILTGTPIQNNLKELWALFDFVHQGSLLGTARTFKMEYENPITRARERDATIGERKLGQEMAESLKKIIGPYFLRRTKAEVTETKDGIKTVSDDAGKMPSLTRKNDLILWVFLTQTQQKVYQDFLSLDSVKELLMTKKSPLVALTVLKKITDHPRLLSTRAVAQLGIDDHGLDEDQLESEEAYQSAVNQIKNVDNQILIKESGKLIVLVELLDKLKEEGHRTLVFSQSRKLLDIIDKVMSGRGHKVMRLDGTVTHLSERDQRMQKFQSDNRYSVFLLTTQVGGVGLTLTAADRVVIYDPSWNPATDAQAVDRAFRIGQEKNVVIYRMITCGTVEEKIYRRQIFKDSITRQATGNTKNPYRYFTKSELRELFQLDNPTVSSTQQQLEQMHSGYRKTDESLDAHIAYLYSLDIFGISDHDLMFGQVKDNVDDIDEEYKEEDSHLNGNDYIQARVQKAQELLKLESNLSQPMSHYPSGEGQSSRPRGPSEWNMPSGVPQTYGGPENVVDMTAAEDSDTDMVDLTESSPKNTGLSTPESLIPTSNHVKQESPQEFEPIIKQETNQLDTGNTPNSSIKSEPVSPGIKLEPESPNMKSVVSQPDLSNRGIKSEPKSPSNNSKSECEKTDIRNHGTNMEDNEIIIESDEENCVEMENDEHRSITINSDDERNDSRVIMSDDVIMVTPGKTPLKQNLEEMTIDSPMKVDSENTTPQRSPLKSIENVKKGIGSAVKLFGGQISNTLSSIVSMVTPELQKTPGKSRRKSVCQSPWLAKTPKSGQKNVINEELLISPDGCRPVMMTSRKLNIPLTSQAMTEARMNSTIMSAFGNSPTSQRSHSRSSGSSLSEQGETSIQESPSPKRYSDLVQDSPTNSSDTSRTVNESTSLVLESVQNTPAVINNSAVIEDSDIDGTPKRPTKQGSEINESVVDDSDIDGTPKRPDKQGSEINKSVIDDSDIDGTPESLPKPGSTFNESLVDESQDANDLNHLDSPIATSRRKKRKAVIESSDEESDDEMDKDDMDLSENIENSENVSKSRCLDSESDNNEEDEPQNSAKKFSDKKSFVDDESESDDEDYDDEDSFIDDEDSDDVSDEDEEENDFDSLSDEMKNQFERYVRAGRSLYKKGNYNEALVNILQALEIFPHNEVQALAIKINKKIEGS